MNIVSALFGLILLVAGRRLFWFFVAVAGFAAGSFIARDQLHLDSQWLVIAIALLAGLIGALLSVFLQKLAIALAGFAAGGYLCAIVLQRLNLERYATIGFVAGGIIGAILLLTLFDWALVILSSLIGAAFLADGIGTPDNALLIFGIAFPIGVIIQSLQMPRRRRQEPAAKSN